MLAKYMSPFLTAARPSAYLVRPFSYLRTTLATRPSSFVRDRSSFQLRTAHSNSPNSEPKAAKQESKQKPKQEEPEQEEPKEETPKPSPPKPNLPTTNTPTTNTPTTNTPTTNTPTTNTPTTNTPTTNTPTTNTPTTNTPTTNTPTTNTPTTNTPTTNTPTTNTQETNQTNTNQTNMNQTNTNQKNPNRTNPNRTNPNPPKRDWAALTYTTIAIAFFTGEFMWVTYITTYETYVGLENKKYIRLQNEKKNDEAVLYAIEKGSYPDLGTQVTLITRKEIIDELQNIFRISYDYHLVVGEVGTGKTTVITQAAKAVGEGVVYIKGSNDLSEFSKSFADALGWSYEIAAKDKQDPEDKLDRAMEAFRSAAAKYKAKHKKPAVLILDDISGLAQTNPKIFKKLQDTAKDVTDYHEFTFVFVVSEGTIPTMMSNSSAWTRASKHPLLIGDFTEDEALEYLKDKLKLKGGEENAKKLYNLLGGRVKLLQSYGGQINDGRSFEDVRRAAFGEAADYFRMAGIVPIGESKSIGKKIIQELIKRKDRKMTRNEFVDFFDDVKYADKLLQENVFSYNVVDRTITFQSRLMESYVMANPKEFGLE